MARVARVVIPFYPHPVTQRGNRRQRTFFGDAMFVHTLERITGRVLTCRPPGRKRKAEEI